ncbi:AAA family ATPase [Spirosoma sp. HMF4905]|uniref:AAA family ATPase n=2 Tax=Spirosoma arboris TaxID=2682092 RepID=A0A7K1S8T0_9BACT|nr:AAA family ATPase [Spirosoma arboris]
MENTAPNTNNFLNWVEIKNFKSIKDLRLDCKRVNVFIGKPNVGKSNILEGLGLLGASYSDVQKSKRLFKDFVRFTSLSNLFYDDDININASIKTDKISSELAYDSASHLYYFFIGNEEWIKYANQAVNNYRLGLMKEEDFERLLTVLSDLLINPQNSNPEENCYENIKVFGFGGSKGQKLEYGSYFRLAGNPIKRYEFNGTNNIGEIGQNYLLPPYGNNLFNVIDHNEEIRKDLAEVFRPNGLNLVLSKKDRKFSVQKQIDGYVYDYPYSNIADTFQRYAFYLAAIESNANSVIVLEEPEVHSFPPYTQELTYRMIYSEENQFFVTTHSPYLLQTLIENLTDDQLNVFVTYYENYETKVRALTSNELREVMDFGIDIFYNLEKYQPNA